MLTASFVDTRITELKRKEYKNMKVNNLKLIRIQEKYRRRVTDRELIELEAQNEET